MKNLNTILFLSFLFIISSCSSDDDSSPQDSPVMGTWEMTALNVDRSFDLNNDGTTSTNIFAESQCYSDNYITFYESGTVEIFYSLTDISLELPDNYTFHCVDPILVEATYTMEDDELLVSFLDYKATGSISGNTLIATFEEFFILPYNDNGTVRTQRENTTITFVKS